MTDDDFLRAFFELSLPHTAFHHVDHLRLTWLVVKREGQPAAERLLANGIQRYAAAHGHRDRYHETITRFWVRLVAHAIVDGRSGPEDAFDEFVAAYPLLLDSGLPLRHWSREALFSAEARRTWQEPDLVALPF